MKLQGHSAAREGYRWTCPFCGTSRLNASDEESGRRNALVALRTHVLASVEDGHGPRNEYPDGYDDVTLADHLQWVDERRGRADARG